MRVARFSLLCPFLHLMDRERHCSAPSTGGNAIVEKAQEKPPRAPFGRHARALQPILTALKANRGFPFARWNGSKVYFQAGNRQTSSSWETSAEWMPIDARKRRGPRSQPCGWAAGGIDKQVQSSGHQIAPQYFIKHSQRENRRQTAAI